MVTADVWQAFEACELSKRGSWPNAGGWLDQPRVLLDAISSIKASEAHFRSPAAAMLEEDEE